MLPGSNRGAGGNFGFPDVCNTPVGPATVPIPYPNFAFNAMAFPFCLIVRLSYVNALNMGSSIPMTSGDEAGVAHPMFKQAGRYSLGNVKIFLEKLPGIMMGCLTTGNNCNNPIGAVLIPSITNVFLSDASREHTLAEDHGVDARPWRAAAVSTQLLAALTPDGDSVCEHPITAEVGCLSIRRFDAVVPTLAARAIDRLVAGGAKTVVIDLRGNPGGDLDAARRLAEELLPRGAVIMRLHEPDGDETVVTSRHDGRAEPDLVLLVDRATASAAEVLAGCLQWHGRARVVGEPTYGKGRAQALRHTNLGVAYGDVFQCALPDGTPIEGRGVVPDLEWNTAPSARR